VVVGVERWLARMERREAGQQLPELAQHRQGWIVRYRQRSMHWALGIDPARGNVPEPYQLASLAELESRASMAGEALRGDP
jgi:hypothetical protein